MLDEFQKYRDLVTPEGRVNFAATVAAFRQHYGEKWLAEFSKQNPDFVIMVDLCANYEFPEAFDKLRDHVREKCDSIESVFTRSIALAGAEAFLSSARNDIAIFHSTVKAEIDKPRI